MEIAGLDYLLNWMCLARRLLFVCIILFTLFFPTLIAHCKSKTLNATKTRSCHFLLYADLLFSPDRAVWLLEHFSPWLALIPVFACKDYQLLCRFCEVVTNWQSHAVWNKDIFRSRRPSFTLCQNSWKSYENLKQIFWALVRWTMF